MSTFKDALNEGFAKFDKDAAEKREIERDKMNYYGDSDSLNVINTDDQ